MSATAAPAPPAEGVEAPSGRTLLMLLALTGGGGVAVSLARAVVGVAVSLAAWGFLELLHVIQQFAFTNLPRDLGFSGGAPVWWPLPVLGLAGALTGVAICP